MNQFIDDIINNFYVSIHTFQSDNWDFDRFQSFGKDAQNIVFVDYYKSNLQMLFENQNQLEYVNSILSDLESKEWLKNLLIYRTVGHLHFRLPTNSEEHWQIRDKAKHLSNLTSDLNYSGMFGNLKKYVISFEQENINIDCWWSNLAWAYLFKQYYLNRNHIKIQPEQGDYIIDAGACLGETALAFAASVRENGKVFAFEIDPENLKIFRHNLMQNENLAKRIVIKNYALSDTPDSQLYLHGQGPSAKVSNQQSNIPIKTATIDQLVNEGEIDKIDFIKMDIEGSELQALHGAVETIRKFRPKLAISIYHKLTDIFEIPAFIDSLNLGYQLFIEHYSIHTEETVLYAKYFP
jgi:FkbM family methyltransferase